MTAPIPPVVIKYLVDGVETVVTGNARVSRSIDPVAAAMAKANVVTTSWERGLQKLASQQVATATAGGTLFGPGGLLSSSLKGLSATSLATSALTKAIGGLGAGYLATKVGGFIRDQVEAAAAMHELAQRTGATTETLSVLQFAGEQAGVTIDDISVSFKGLSVALGGLRDGNREVVQAFDAIGLSAVDLKDLSVDEAFERIAVALGHLPAGFERAEAAQRIFGRSGAALIPLLDDLATNGFDAAREAAEKYNAVVTTEQARQADEFTDAVKRLGIAAKGVGRDIGIGLIPPLTAFLELMTADIPQHGLDESLARLGESRVFAGIGPIPRSPVGGRISGAGRSFGDSTETSPATADEIRALAAVREAGKLTEAQQQRITALVTQLNAEYESQGVTVQRQAVILGQIRALTHDLKETKAEQTDAERQALQLMQAQAQEAGKLLQIEGERRQQLADLAQQFVVGPLAPGKMPTFDTLIAEQRKAQTAPVSPLADARLTLEQQNARQLAELYADATIQANQLVGETDALALSTQNLGQSIRDGVAGEIVNFFTEGIAAADSFGDAVVALFASIGRSILQVEAQLLASTFVRGLFGAGGIPGAPGGLGDLGSLVALAPTFHTGGLIDGAGEVNITALSGEMVVNRAATAKHFDLLQAINTDALDRLVLNTPTIRTYHTGGMVTAARDSQHTVTLEMPEGVHAQVMGDSDFIKLVVRHRRKVRGVLDR